MFPGVNGVLTLKELLKETSKKDIRCPMHIRLICLWKTFLKSNRIISLTFLENIL